jgi:methionyl-tRNA synthetase
MGEIKRYTVTAALPYANGPLHIGHLAGAYLNADIFVRFLRMTGKDVLFVCGSDEHGAAITLRAKKEGISPKEIIDKYHAIIKDSFEQLGVSFDIYHRTSSELHHQTSQDFFLKLIENNALEVLESEQFYDAEYNQFLADRYITGTCPKCQNPNAYGDQCEKCGSTLSPTELGNPISTLSGKTPTLKTTKHWYLPLDKYEGWLQKWIVEEKKGIWKTNVYGQCKSWIDGGLHARAMTRDLDWGVKVPLPNEEGKVLYVWLDAPIGYISATKQWALDHGKDWELYWKNDETRLIHFIGKDNIVFHCITFPTLLKAHGDFILPDNVPANEFMNLQGDKISTSRNWAVWAHEYLADYPNKVDELRYTLISNMPETKDSEFTWEDYQLKVNSELVATLGNFINRVAVLIQKYWNGVVPEIAMDDLGDLEIEVLESITFAQSSIANAIQNYTFREALNVLMAEARLGNKYLADTEPWKLIKTDEVGAQKILYTAAQVAGALGVLCRPFLPFTSDKISAIFKVNNEMWLNDNLIVKGGITLAEVDLLFEKIEDSFVEKQVAHLMSTKTTTLTETPKYAPMKPEITFDDFTKLDIRTGIIVSAEKIPKADKLLHLKVDIGLEQRTIVSGIAEHFAPEEVVGQKVSVVINLAPRALRGVVSQGMILMAEDENGKLSFIATDGMGAGMVIR